MHSVQRCGPVLVMFCGLCVCVLCSLVTAVSCAKTAEPIEMPFGDVFSDGPKEPCFRWGFGSPKG